MSRGPQPAVASPRGFLSLSNDATSARPKSERFRSCSRFAATASPPPRALLAWRACRRQAARGANCGARRGWPHPPLRWRLCGARRRCPAATACLLSRLRRASLPPWRTTRSVLQACPCHRALSRLPPQALRQPALRGRRAPRAAATQPPRAVGRRRGRPARACWAVQALGQRRLRPLLHARAGRKALQPPPPPPRHPGAHAAAFPCCMPPRRDGARPSQRCETPLDTQRN